MIFLIYKSSTVENDKVKTTNKTESEAYNRIKETPFKEENKVENSVYASSEDVYQAEKFLSILPSRCANACAVPDGTIIINVSCSGNNGYISGSFDIKNGKVLSMRDYCDGCFKRLAARAISGY